MGVSVVAVSVSLHVTVSEDMQDWIQFQFGILLGNLPTSRVRNLVELLSSVPRGDWDHLRDGAAALVSVPETYVGRHPECFDALERFVADASNRSPGRELRLWSAGCATGEEAYTMGAVASGAVSAPVRVYGTDICPRAIAVARTGRYQAWSLRGRPASTFPWLEWRNDGQVGVAERVRALVSFRQGSLTQCEHPAGIDVAFCRNVLMYLSEDGASRALQRIASALQPEGVLVVSPTDPIPSELKAWRVVPVDVTRPVRAFRPPPRLQSINTARNRHKLLGA